MMPRRQMSINQTSASSEVHVHIQNGHQENISRNRRRSWQSMPELPSRQELMSSESPTLPKNPKTPKSKDEYLETQYLLNRHEGIEPLRQAMYQYRRDPRMQETHDVNIYTKVRTQGYVLNRIGAASRLSFHCRNSSNDISWTLSGRLTPGTLVALSPHSDNFQSECFVAIVTSQGGPELGMAAGRAENTKLTVDVSWADLCDAPLDPMQELVMVEAVSGYFEAVRYTLLGLQHAALYRSRFDKYIIEASMEPKIAEYLRKSPDYVAVKPVEAEGFDQSQMDAFNQMTSRELSVVQGPPGTGKTFTSTMVIQSLVNTLNICFSGVDGDETSSAPSPIIITAQTNHALDQLLALCIKSNAGKIVRLGARSRSETMNEHTLFNIQQRSQVQPTYTKAEASCRSIIRSIRQLVRRCLPAGQIHPRDLFNRGLISQPQLESLVATEWESSFTNGVEEDISAWLDNILEYEAVHIHSRSRSEMEMSNSEDSKIKTQNDGGVAIEGNITLTGQFILLPSDNNQSVPHDTDRGAVWRDRAKHLLATYSDLYEVKPIDRGIVYRYLQERIRFEGIEDLRRYFKEYERACSELKASRLVHSARVLQAEKIQIIGCTTTGLTKYRGLLTAMRPRVLLVEEAAETREANITAALLPSLEQLILVGDHQQLAPHVDVRILGFEPYNLTVSLFERLVQLGMPHITLKCQRRMIPDICKIVQAFYPQLLDHASVKDNNNRPPIPGMGDQSLWWFYHQWPEKQDEHSPSYVNDHEAAMIAGFATYLVANGTLISEITILTYYTSQVRQIEAALHKIQKSTGIDTPWMVRTVDGFQGEENDVILLSLVRSPHESSADPRSGFVADVKRAAVAISRAKRGLYVFGNVDNLLRDPFSNKTWCKIWNRFEKSNGSFLPIICKQHGSVARLYQPHHWHRVLAGECRGQCHCFCSNGHTCKQPQAYFYREHFTCRNACVAILNCGHRCKELCGRSCSCMLGCEGAVTAGQQYAQGDDLSFLGKQNSPSKNQGSYGSGHEDHHKTEPASRNPAKNAPAMHPLVAPEIYQTSDDLMRKGFHNYVARYSGASGMTHNSTTVGDDASVNGILPLPLIEGLGSVSYGKGLTDKWSPETIRECEEVLENARCRQSSSRPTTLAICETYLATTTSASGERLPQGLL